MTARNAWPGRYRKESESVDSTLEIGPVNRDRIIGIIVELLKEKPLPISKVKQLILMGYEEFTPFLEQSGAYEAIINHMLEKGYFIHRGYGLGVLRLTEESEDILAAVIMQQKEQREQELARVRLYQS